jgi:hypothetical protein
LRYESDIAVAASSGCTTSTARRHIGLLSRALTYAQKDLDIQFKNPMLNIRLPSHKQAITRRAITKDEQKLILEHMSKAADTVEKLFFGDCKKYLSLFNKFYVFRYGQVQHEVDLTVEIRTLTYKQYHCCPVNFAELPTTLTLSG